MGIIECWENKTVPVDALAHRKIGFKKEPTFPESGCLPIGYFFRDDLHQFHDMPDPDLFLSEHHFIVVQVKVDQKSIEEFDFDPIVLRKKFGVDLADIRIMYTAKEQDEQDQLPSFLMPFLFAKDESSVQQHTDEISGAY